MRLVPLVALLLALGPVAAAAQEPRAPAGAPPTQGQAAEPAHAIPASSPECRTGPISFIFIDNHSIFDTGDPLLSPRFAWAYGAANRLHVRTRPSVIRRELLFHTGDCYDPVLLEESARLLRAYDFISRADVYGIRQPDGTYHVVVDTQDQWSTLVDLRVGFDGGPLFQGARIRDANFLGSGQSVGAFFLQRDVTRDYGVSYDTPQLFGTLWDLHAAAGRTSAGGFVDETVQYPFLGEAGRWAVRQAFLREDRLFDYIADDAAREHVLLPVRETGGDVALVTRLGRRGNLTLVGAGISVEDRRYPGIVQFARGHASSARTPADSQFVAAVAGQREALQNVRAVLLVGQRDIVWVQRRGLDALRGVQDVRLGAEVSLALGKSIPSLSDDDDVASTLTVYGAFAAGNFLFAGRFRGDGRRNFHAPPGVRGIEDLYGEGEVFAYWRPAPFPRHTLVLRGAAAGGWFTRTPFQLTLGGDDALRGYRPDRFPGGRRLAGTLEDRIYFGWPFRDVFDLGATLFADVGRIYPGDVPFGIDSGWRASLGAGLRGSFPAGGRTTYRIDVAMPVGGSLNDARLIVSVGELVGLSAPFGTPQIARSRAAGLSGDLFTFPR
ncbi:MAG: hypothetical protein IRZ00_01385 [Gemmatimonadetes bacterium]|nr:hypothetical protein [Gemmatimonadota bacterium]